MSEVVIRINGRIVERVIYWIIIIVLAGLLIWTSLGDGEEPAPEEQVGGTGNVAANAVNETNETEEVDDTPAPTCSDGIQNQDETAVDCGGACAAVNGEYWYDGSCHDDPEPQLSGSVTMSVSDVEVKAAENGALKVSSFEVTIENGLEERFFPTVVAYAKSDSGILLNQQGVDGDDEKAYMGPASPAKLESGETRTVVIDDEGPYVFEQTGYTLGEDFELEVRLFDDDNEKVDEVTVDVEG